jgi:hypothetical protein
LLFFLLPAADLAVGLAAVVREACGSPVRTALLQLTVKEIDGGQSVPMREDLLWSTMEKKKLKSVGDGRLGFSERERCGADGRAAKGKENGGCLG